MIYTPAFERFWSVWPPNGGRYSRKGGKSACLAVWIKRYHWTQADTIVAHVQWLKTTEAWLKDQGAYIPAPLVYLNQQRWDGAEIPDTFAPALETADFKKSREWIADLVAHKQQALGADKSTIRARLAEARAKVRGA